MVSTEKEVSLDDILSSMTNVSSNDLVPILQKIQTAYGCLSGSVLLDMSKKTGIPASQIYGVATFYEQFHFQPLGRHTVKCCRGTPCHVKNGTDIIESVKKFLGIEPGQTTEDMKFTFETVACMGTCFLSPAIMVDDDYYGNLKPNQIEGILKKYE